ncbi:MAG TPA: LysR family transcriptional regulator [Polyangiaceae bacterium]
MDWNDLRYLLAVERHGSLASAAKALQVTKATVSRRLAALEDALGTRVAERKPDGLALTAAGREAVAAAEQVETLLGALSERIAGALDQSPTGTVRLTAPHWLATRLLVPALPDLSARYPGLDVQLVGTNQILNLAQREADLAIRNVYPDHKSLVVRRLCELGGSIYASSLYLERRGRPTSRQDLRGHDVLVYAGLGGMPGFEWLLEAEHGARIAFRANDPEALVGAASAGLGLCAVPCLLGDGEPSLERVPSLGFERCALHLVTHEELKASARIQVVTAFVVELIERQKRTIEG